MQIYMDAVISFTSVCTASCASCCLSCSPTRKERLTTDMVLKTIDDLNSLGIKHLLLSGGEPFLYFEDLLLMVRQAQKNKMSCSINTNAFWCNTVEGTIKKLNELKQSGLTNIITSVDIYHKEYIDIENIRILLQAAKMTGVRPLLNVCGGYKQADEGIVQLLRQLGDALYLVDIRYFPLAIVGSAHRYLSDVELDYTYNVESLKCPSYRTLHIHPDGSVCACCGDLNNKDPFVLGNIHTESILKITANPFECPAYSMVVRKGFRWIYDKLKSDYSHLFALPYNNSCEFCERVFCGDDSLDIINKLLDKCPKKEC